MRKESNGSPVPAGAGSVDPGSGVDPVQLPSGLTRLGCPTLPVPNSGRAALDAEFGRRFPVLHEFLTRVLWENVVRETGTLLVFAEEGRFKACVSDREAAKVAFRSSETIEGLLASVEALLREGSADWREKKGTGRR